MGSLERTLNPVRIIWEKDTQRLGKKAQEEKAEIGVMLTKTDEPVEGEETRRESFLEAVCPCWSIYFGLLASRTMREYIFNIFKKMQRIGSPSPQEGCSHLTDISVAVVNVWGKQNYQSKGVWKAGEWVWMELAGEWHVFYVTIATWNENLSVFTFVEN